MKIPLFIANIVSAILILNLLFASPSTTGFAVVQQPVQKINLNLSPSNPLSFAILFIIVTIGADIYIYMKSKKNKQK